MFEAICSDRAKSTSMFGSYLVMLKWTGSCNSSPLQLFCDERIRFEVVEVSYGRKLVTVKIKKAAYRGVVEASTSPSKE